MHIFQIFRFCPKLPFVSRQLIIIILTYRCFADKAHYAATENQTKKNILILVKKRNPCGKMYKIIKTTFYPFVYFECSFRTPVLSLTVPLLLALNFAGFGKNNHVMRLSSGEIYEAIL